MDAFILETGDANLSQEITVDGSYYNPTDNFWYILFPAIRQRGYEVGIIVDAQQNNSPDPG